MTCSDNRAASPVAALFSALGPYASQLCVNPASLVKAHGNAGRSAALCTGCAVGGVSPVVLLVTGDPSVALCGGCAVNGASLMVSDSVLRWCHGVCLAVL